MGRSAPWVFLAVLAIAAPSAEATHTSARYDFYAAYPNATRASVSYLRGLNAYGTSTSGAARTSLWFRPLAGGSFEQFNTAPFRDCHRDVLRWTAGQQGVLRYLATEADCYALHTRIVFQPGITFMPRSWTAGQPWSASGVSKTVYSENGIPVCTGTNTWRSRIAGVDRATATVHTQTNETQTLAPIAGAPSSTACPATFGWQENFYLGKHALVRSTGGNTATIRSTGHGEWDSVFDGWQPLPPSDAGRLQATPAEATGGSTGNTVVFTYTAPAAGLQGGTLTVAVPPGWTPPATTDAPGCTTATAGTLATSGQTIAVSTLTLPAHGQLTVTYGATAGGACTAADAAAAPSTPGAPVWQGQVTFGPGGRTTSLSGSPAVDVT